MALDITSDRFERRYGYAGGYKGLLEIYNSDLLYNEKIQRIVNKFGVERTTAIGFYAQLRGALK